MTNEEILHVIFEAIDEVNTQMKKTELLQKSADTPLFGEMSVLDSLGFVMFITAVERKIEESLGALIVLADERAMSKTDSPFKTVGRLADHIALLLKEKNG